MTQDQYARVKEIYTAASSASPSKRGLLIERECGGDAELRREVEALLAFDLPDDSDEPAMSQPRARRLATGALVIDRYRIVSLLGSGGMGHVYRAEDLMVGVPVALKFINAPTRAAVERMFAEVRLAREVTHPSVCRVYDLAEMQGEHFITMQFIEGQDLHTLLYQVGRLPSERVSEIGGALCDGLAAAHERGVLHRDLKPANVVIDLQGRPVLIDFGIARVVTDPGAELIPVGTPAYMAPEQLTPGKSATERTDVYALGLLLYELVAGSPAFEAPTTRELIELQKHAKPPPLGELAPGIDPILEEVIDRALAKRPDDRFQSAREMREGLLQPRPAPREVTRATRPVPGGGDRADERRQLTVMHCELTRRSTGSPSVDPEEELELADALRERCRGFVDRYGGRVAHHTAKSLVAYFGHPVAHEDDAERAVRAGCDLLASEASADALGFRVGVHTGQVIVRASDEVSAEPLVFGDAGPFAARLAGLGRYAVVVSEPTRRLLGRSFAAERLDRAIESDHGESLLVHEVRLATNRDQDIHASADRFAPLVGREQDLATLADRWQRAREGMGQVVLVCAEAGVGKSRLIRGFREQVDAPHRWLETGCSPFREGTAFAPLSQLVQDVLGLEDKPTDEQVDRLRAVLERFGMSSEETLQLFAAILGLQERGGDDSRPLDARHRQISQAWVQWMLAVSDDQPLILVLEDLHWCDPSTLEVLGYCIEQVPTAKLLLVLSFRPESEPPWPTSDHQSILRLARLRKSDARALVAPAAEAAALPPGVLDQIVSRADGVPLFLEELVKMAAEPGVPGADRIPSTLQDSLMARLDRLGEAKEVAQLCACLGREFSYRLLAATWPAKEPSLLDGLSRLVQAELLYVRGTPPEARYTFKHALIHDVAYQSQLRRDRRRAHARIAEVLESRFPALCDVQPELLARHAEAGELHAVAASASRRAGERAVAVWANAEAITHFSRCLENLEKCPSSDEVDRETIEVLVAHSGALVAVGGYASEVLEQAFAHNLELAERLGRVDALVPSLYGLWNVDSTLGLPACLPQVERLLEVARDTDDPKLVIVGNAAALATALYRGRHEEVRQYASVVRAHQDPALSWQLFGEMVPVYALVAAGYSAWMAGRPDDAAALCAEARTLASEHGSPHDISQAAGVSATVAFESGASEQANRLATECVELASEHDYPWWTSWGALYQGACAAAGGEVEQGVARMQTSLEVFDAARPSVIGSLATSCIARAWLEHDEPRKALEFALTAYEAGRPRIDRLLDAELLRIAAEASAALNEPANRVSELLRNAREVAVSQGALSFELRVGMAEVRLASAEGDPAPAVSRLAACYDRFDQGFDTADLRAARKLTLAR